MSHSDDGSMELFALSLYLLPLIYVIMAIYATMKLLRYKHCMFMKKRSIQIVFGLNLSLISAIIAVVTLDICIMYYHDNDICFILGTIFLWLSWWSVLYFLNTKNWMIYYKYWWTYFTLQLKWQRIINPNISEELEKTNWFIHNIKSYGNLNYISKIFGLFHFIGCCMCIAATDLGLFNIDKSMFIMTLTIGLYSLSLLPTILFYAVIVCKTPSFDDAFHLHWECKMHRNIIIMSVLSWICVMLVISYTGSFNITSIIAVSSLTTAFYAMSYVSTTMIVKKNKHFKGDTPRSPKMSSSSVPQKPPRLSIVNLSQQSSLRKASNMEKKIKLDDIFMNKKTLNIFMIHLSKEYSMECLLSYIEFTQFQSYLLSKMPEYERAHHSILAIKLFTNNLPSNVPKSVIIDTSTPNGSNHSVDLDPQESAVIDSAKRRAHKLYKKYIEPGGAYEINISGNMRYDLSQILSNLEGLNKIPMKLKDLLLLFQEPKDEMTNLLNFSFMRLKQTEEWQQIIKIFQNQSSNIMIFKHRDRDREGTKTQSRTGTLGNLHRLQRRGLPDHYSADADIPTSNAKDVLSLSIIQQSEPLPATTHFKVTILPPSLRKDLVSKSQYGSNPPPAIMEEEDTDNPEFKDADTLPSSSNTNTIMHMNTGKPMPIRLDLKSAGDQLSPTSDLHELHITPKSVALSSPTDHLKLDLNAVGSSPTPSSQEFVYVDPDYQ